MAMRVDGYRGGFIVEPQRVRFLRQQVFNELLEEKTAGSDGFGAGQFQLAIILGEHRVARRFKEKNWRVRLVGGEQPQVVPAKFRGIFKVSLAERGPATAAAPNRQ